MGGSHGGVSKQFQRRLKDVYPLRRQHGMEHLRGVSLWFALPVRKRYQLRYWHCPQWSHTRVGNRGDGQRSRCSAAIDQCNGVELDGRPLSVRLDNEPEKGGKSGGGNQRGGDPALEGKVECSSGVQVVVRNLPWSVTSEMLRGTFEQIGTVTDANVIYHADSGRSKGWGTVRFEKPDEAQDAIARFGGVELAGRPMTVMMDRFN